MSQDLPLGPHTSAAGRARKAATSMVPNAMKHGAFSSIDLLPWEDAEEFEALQRGLLEKYSPDGPLQQDCMASIASLMWRKRRIQKKREFDLATELNRADNAILWRHPLPLCDDEIEWIKQQLAASREADRANSAIRVSEEYDQLFNFSCSLYRANRASIVRIAISMLPAEFRDHLSTTCLEDDCETTSQWIAAIKREVDAVLLPVVRKRYPAPISDRYFEAASNVMNEKRLFSDLAAEERIERNIDQLLGRFFKLQAADELVAHKKKTQVRMIEASATSAKA